MSKAKFITTLLVLVCFSVYGQAGKDVNINFMLRGYIYAESSIADTMAAGGFGGSDNLPIRMDSDIFFSEKGFFIKIDTAKKGIFAKEFNAYKLYIGNNTDSIVNLEASDSRLYVTAEVFYQNKWQPIEYLPSSWCGNSYHHVYLKQHEYWSFDIPKYSGNIKTKLRYKLMMGKGRSIYSNVIPASFNKKQLSLKQGHKPGGMMDPYFD